MKTRTHFIKQIQLEMTMFFSKYLLPVLLQFFSARTGNASLSSQTLMLNAVTDVLKKEFSKFFLKIVFGLVATGVLIYSLVVLGQHLQFYLLLYDNGTIFSVMFFAALSLLCVFSLFKLFYQKDTRQDPFSALFSEGEEKIGFGKIYENFMSGLTDGLHERHKAEKAPRYKVDESKVKRSETTH